MPTGPGAPASLSLRDGMAAAQASHLRGSLVVILVLLVAGASGYLALLRSLPPLKVLALRLPAPARLPFARNV